MTKKLYKLMNWADVEGIVYAEEDDPHRLLGPHVRGMNTMIQFFYPGAVSAVIVIGKNRYAMELADEEGYFAALVPKAWKQTVIPWKYGCRTDRLRKYVIPIVLDL